MFKNYRNYSISNGVKTAGLAVYNNGAGKVAVILHKTIVVEKTGQTITLRNGGWDTVSTRTVINTALEQLCASTAHVYRKKGETFLMQNGVSKPFISGMKIKTALREVTS